MPQTWQQMMLRKGKLIETQGSNVSPLKILCRVVMDVGGMENCFEIHVPFCIICLFGRFPFVWWVFLEGMTR